jgi:hypothetical protein
MGVMIGYHGVTLYNQVSAQVHEKSCLGKFIEKKKGNSNVPSGSYSYSASHWMKLALQKVHHLPYSSDFHLPALKDLLERPDLIPTDVASHSITDMAAGQQLDIPDWRNSMVLPR